MKEKKAKVLVGTVVSDAMDKSRVVLVKRKIRHPFYTKVINKSTKLMIHDEKNESKKGDLVEITYYKPISKKKSFRLVNILQKAASTGNDGIV
jgi:small subunit ribosomal protein S17